MPLAKSPKCILTSKYSFRKNSKWILTFENALEKFPRRNTKRKKIPISRLDKGNLEIILK